MSEYIWEDGPLFIKHLDGVKWYDAPVPPRKHECWVQTMGVLPSGEAVERCACGAVKNPRYRSWLEKNSRESDEPEAKEPWWNWIYSIRRKSLDNGFYDTERGDY